MNVVFLDVDGILAYADYDNRETSNIDVAKVKMLKEICDETNSCVVITSSWRGNKDYTPRIYTTLIDILEKYGINVYGDAPYADCRIYKDSNGKIKMEYGTGRAYEIKMFLDKHNVENFVILDDEDWSFEDYGLENNVVKPSYYYGGLQEEHVEQAIKILKRKTSI